MESVNAAASRGIGWIRADRNWSSIHATQAAYDADVAAGGLWPGMAALRTAINYAHAQQIKVLVLALDSPSWAHGTNRLDGGDPLRQAILPTFRTQFAEYARQLALAGADAIEVMNEPNFSGGGGYSFGPSHPRAAFPAERVDDYVLLLKAVYARIKPGFPSVQIGVGGIAKVGHDQISVSPDFHSLEWYTAMFNAKADDRTTPITAAGSFDFANVHSYADRNIPAGPKAWGARQINQADDAVYFHGFANPWRIRQLLVAQGLSAVKLWCTEAGAPTAGTSIGSPPITEALQATWLAEANEVWLSVAASGFGGLLSPTWYGSFTGPLFIYQWHDVSDGVIAPTTTEGFYGIVRYDRSPKPAWAVLLAEAVKLL